MLYFLFYFFKTTDFGLKTKEDKTTLDNISSPAFVIFQNINQEKCKKVKIKSLKLSLKWEYMGFVTENDWKQDDFWLNQSFTRDLN